MYFKPYYLGCLAQASYLVGGSNGDAAVIDPRRDVDEYIADAAAANLRIRYVIETHLHADFVSGHAELARRTGATILIGADAHAGFPHRPVSDGDAVAMGDTTLRFMNTPGHTPESIVVVAECQGEAPMAFTGDTLFVGDVGRPDLVGSQGMTAEQMARAMYRSLRDKVLALPEETQVWPAHGAGSACGKAIGSDRSSTVGRERTFNHALHLAAAGDEEEFVSHTTAGLGAPPMYFASDSEHNRAGAGDLGAVVSCAAPMDPDELERSCHDLLVLDVRETPEFCAAHVPGSINVGLDGQFAPWFGTVEPLTARTVVVAPPGREREAVMRLARVGCESAVGWLDGGITAWQRAGKPVAHVPELSGEEAVASAGRGVTILDVRTCLEYGGGHVPGSVNIPLDALAMNPAAAPVGPLAVMCGSGYRSGIACSLLAAAGRADVANVAGGWEAVEPALLTAGTGAGA